MFPGTAVDGRDGSLMSMSSGTPKVDSVNAIADLSGLPPGKKMTYTIELFETLMHRITCGRQMGAKRCGKKRSA
jgi:hypothetical protein